MKFFYLVFVFFLFQPLVTQGASLNIVINEIAWMGTGVSYNDEWIEFYNASDNSVNLEGWVLKAEDGTPEINLSGTISPNGFYLLERTDDDTVPEISADLIYKGALGNSGENLKLYDNSGNLIDEVNCSDGWLAGDNSTKQTMERSKSMEAGPLRIWQTSQSPGGTPKEKNQELRIMNYEDDEPEKTTEVGPLSTEPVSYPTGIVFSEVLPSPEGPDAENEWIEIFNQNNFKVNLSGWKIKDSEGKITIYVFSKETKIPPLGYLVLKRPETKITLNNSGDSLNLIQPNEEIIDSVTFGKAPLGQSYNRTPTTPQRDPAMAGSGWDWSTTLTPGTKNIVPAHKVSKQNLREEKAEDSPPLFEKETAAIGEKVFKSSNYLFTLLIAFTIAIFSAIIILIFKKTITPKSPSDFS